jgi:hypothetical protein
MKEIATLLYAELYTGFNTMAPDSGQKTGWRHPTFAKGHKKMRHA